MASLEAYIAQLDSFADNLPKIVVSAGVENEDDITQIVKSRLLDKGLDAKLSLIGGGQYAPRTIEEKKLLGQETGHFTLFYKGGFHDGMFVDSLGDFLFIDSSDAKTRSLINEYGKDILGLTQPETKFVVQWYIDPKIQKTINSFPKVINI